MKTEEAVYRVLATAYPHQYYEENPTRFCEFLRSQGYDIADDQIKKSIEDTK